MADRRQKKPNLRFLLLVPVVSLAFLAAAFLSQEKKLNEIEAQKTESDQAIVEMQSEIDRLKRMIEYAKTDEYKIEYAREVLGFVMPEDVKLQAEEE